MTLDGRIPGGGGFHRITGAPGIEVRRGTQAGELLNGLVSRAIFTQADGVMGKHVNHLLAHQRRHADRVTHVLHEDQESRTVRYQTAVQGDAVHDRPHAKLTDTVVQVVAAGVFRGDRFGAFPEGQVRRCQVGTATQQFRHLRADHIQRFERGFA